MTDTLTKRKHQLEEDLDSLLARLTAYSDETLNKSPEEGAWSAMQTLHHMSLAESLSLKYVQKKLSYNPELKKTNLLTHLRRLSMYVSFWIPVKIKAPAAISGEALPKESKLNDLITAWKEQRAATWVYLESLPDHLFQVEIYKHPFAGRLDLAGMLVFYQAHFDRHKKQILRTLEKVSK